MEEGICENTLIHEDTVKNVKEKMPEDGLIYDIAELFKVFADSTRMKIIYALMEEELCVCDIANIVQTTQSAISHQLRILKQSKLVKYRKEGNGIYLSVRSCYGSLLALLLQGAQGRCGECCHFSG